MLFLKKKNKQKNVISSERSFRKYTSLIFLSHLFFIFPVLLYFVIACVISIFYWTYWSTFQALSDHLLNKQTSEWIVNLLTQRDMVVGDGLGWGYRVWGSSSHLEEMASEQLHVQPWHSMERLESFGWYDLLPLSLTFIPTPRNNSFFLSLCTLGWLLFPFFISVVGKCVRSILLCSVNAGYYIECILKDGHSCAVLWSASYPSVYNLQSLAKCLKIVETKFLMNA